MVTSSPSPLASSRVFPSCASFARGNHVETRGKPKQLASRGMASESTLGQVRLQMWVSFVDQGGYRNYGLSAVAVHNWNRRQASNEPSACATTPADNPSLSCQHSATPFGFLTHIRVHEQFLHNNLSAVARSRTMILDLVVSPVLNPAPPLCRRRVSQCWSWLLGCCSWKGVANFGLLLCH